jgi:hypothetical protein
MKVDPAKAKSLTKGKRGPAPDLKEFPVTRAPYRREPYVRATIDGTTIDAKAIGWTREHVHLKWQDAEYEMHTLWVPATAVHRIERDESAWRDPYDILD